MVVLAPSALDQGPAFRITDLTVILALPALACLLPARSLAAAKSWFWLDDTDGQRTSGAPHRLNGGAGRLRLG